VHVIVRCVCICVCVCVSARKALFIIFEVVTTGLPDPILH